MFAIYLLYIVTTSGPSKACFSGQRTLLISFLVILWLVTVVQCLTGSNVLRWRSFYASNDVAWRAHYMEVFDNGIREALCCLGPVKYKSDLRDDDTSAVAKLLGDLMAYRASGTGHLELLAGLALLQKYEKPTISYDGQVEAPEVYIREAALFHPFAEAAYTGILLDLGRNPFSFPCVWLYRQSALTPWTRARRPTLEGDNWWRGHAAAFLKHVKLSPEALRKGCVSQRRQEAAYFVAVLHDLRTVVIAIRGTETLEDVLTDGLCGECFLSPDDLDGLINADQLPRNVRESVLSSFPHYGHAGIVESARGLYMKLEGQQTLKQDGSEPEATGFLSSLMGPGRECHGYQIRIIGHSLGGAIATLLGIRLYRRFPDLHVYSYGALLCVDSVIAEACSQFVTSIVYNDEFSARLSVNSIVRLRSSAMRALLKNSSPNSFMISKLVGRILNARKHTENVEQEGARTSALQPVIEAKQANDRIGSTHLVHVLRGGVFLFGQAISCLIKTPNHRSTSINLTSDYELSFIGTSETDTMNNGGIRTVKMSADSDQHHRLPLNVGVSPAEVDSANDDANILQNGRTERDKGLGSRYLDSRVELVSAPEHAVAVVDDCMSVLDKSAGQSPEMHLPGLIIHIVPVHKIASPPWKSWIVHGERQGYKAILADRQSFLDIVVSPNMFVDHMPWRCRYAMQRVLETRKREQHTPDLLKGENGV